MVRAIESRVLLALAFGLVACSLAACGASKLTVRHFDPGYEAANVYVDEERIGRVQYGKDMTVRLEPGLHEVQVYPEGAIFNPWTLDGGGWRFVLDRRATITLLPDTTEWP